MNLYKSPTKLNHYYNNINYTPNKNSYLSNSTKVSSNVLTHVSNTRKPILRTRGDDEQNNFLNSIQKSMISNDNYDKSPGFSQINSSNIFFDNKNFKIIKGIKPSDESTSGFDRKRTKGKTFSMDSSIKNKPIKIMNDKYNLKGIKNNLNNKNNISRSNDKFNNSKNINNTIIDSNNVISELSTNKINLKGISDDLDEFKLDIVNIVKKMKKKNSGLSGSDEISDFKDYFDSTLEAIEKKNREELMHIKEDIVNMNVFLSDKLKGRNSTKTDPTLLTELKNKDSETIHKLESLDIKQKRQLEGLKQIFINSGDDKMKMLAKKYLVEDDKELEKYKKYI
jgi:hypothetical protein